MYLLLLLLKWTYSLCSMQLQCRVDKRTICSISLEPQCNWISVANQLQYRGVIVSNNCIVMKSQKVWSAISVALRYYEDSTVNISAWWLRTSTKLNRKNSNVNKKIWKMDNSYLKQMQIWANESAAVAFLWQKDEDSSIKSIIETDCKLSHNDEPPV